MVGLDVRGQGAVRCERFRTFLTAERPLSGVRADVDLQRGRSVERFVAVLADKRPGLDVPHVDVVLLAEVDLQIDLRWTV